MQFSSSVRIWGATFSMVLWGFGLGLTPRKTQENDTPERDHWYITVSHPLPLTQIFKKSILTALPYTLPYKLTLTLSLLTPFYHILTRMPNTASVGGRNESGSGKSSERKVQD